MGVGGEREGEREGEGEEGVGEGVGEGAAEEGEAGELGERGTKESAIALRRMGQIFSKSDKSAKSEGLRKVQRQSKREMPVMEMKENVSVQNSHALLPLPAPT